MKLTSDKCSYAAEVIAAVHYADHVSLTNTDVTLAMRPLGSADTEVWRSRLPVTRGTRGAVAFAHDEHVLAGAIASSDPDVERAARVAYGEIVGVLRAEGFPFFLRIWNHVRDLNAQCHSAALDHDGESQDRQADGDRERYKCFSAGRHDALVAAGLTKSDFPAASAVGMRDGNLSIHFLASRERGRNVENPRQVSAYDYPRQYGLRSPSFARATIAQDGSVFISGTSSVRGHETLHAGDVEGQLEETIANLNRIAVECGRSLGEAQALKLYVRHAAGAARIVERFRESAPAASLLVLESDICRAGLLLEAEAVILSDQSSIVHDVCSQ
ncbi:MAG TPA: hypothetical protein VF713_03880 [Thermoanaerobaculia bacterium]